jgi:hypothetical protein
MRAIAFAIAAAVPRSSIQIRTARCRADLLLTLKPIFSLIPRQSGKKGKSCRVNHRLGSIPPFDFRNSFEAKYLTEGDGMGRII